jgi:hypothetical protein
MTQNDTKHMQANLKGSHYGNFYYKIWYMNTRLTQDYIFVILEK